MKLYTLVDGEPVRCLSRDTWLSWMAKHPEQVGIAQTVRKHETVSSVFVGASADVPPLPFETMIFGGPRDGFQERSATRAEALALHEKLIAE